MHKERQKTAKAGTIDTGLLKYRNMICLLMSLCHRISAILWAARPFHRDWEPSHFTISCWIIRAVLFFHDAAVSVPTSKAYRPHAFRPLCGIPEN